MLYRDSIKEVKQFYMALNRDLQVFLCNLYKMLRNKEHLDFSKEQLWD